jgi:hypothetical protein
MNLAAHVYFFLPNPSSFLHPSGQGILSSFMVFPLHIVQSSTWSSLQKFFWPCCHSSSKPTLKHRGQVLQLDIGIAAKLHVGGLESSLWPVAPILLPRVMPVTTPSRTTMQSQDVIVVARLICALPSNLGQSRIP